MSRNPVFGLPLSGPVVALKGLFVLPQVSGLSTMGGVLVGCRLSDLVATSLGGSLAVLSPLG